MERTELVKKFRYTFLLVLITSLILFCIVENTLPSKKYVESRAIIMEQYIRARYTSVPKEIATLIAKYTDELCEEYDVSFILVVGLMEVESRFNPFAKSSSGAKGLMQVMPNIWAGELGLEDPKDLHNIRTGIESGIYILKHYIDKNNGNLTMALKNYNGTSGNEFHSMVYKHVGRFALFKERMKS